jgi:type IV secretory pathway VirB2 component (pilin)
MTGLIRSAIGVIMVGLGPLTATQNGFMGFLSIVVGMVLIFNALHAQEKSKGY